MRKETEDNNDNQGQGMLDAILRANEEAHKPKGMLDSILSASEAAERQREEEAAQPKGMMDSVIAATDSQSGQAGSADSGVWGQTGAVASGDGGYSTSDAGASATSPSFDELYPPWTGEDEEFVGSGGVGSQESMEAMRLGHEAAGTEFNSEQRSADDINRSDAV